MGLRPVRGSAGNRIAVFAPPVMRRFAETQTADVPLVANRDQDGPTMKMQVTR